jgi:acyl carrier protein
MNKYLEKIATQTIDYRVKKVISNSFGIPKHKILNTQSFVKDLKLDPLDTTMLCMDLESEFGKEISDDKAGKMLTVQHAIDYFSK